MTAAMFFHAAALAERLVGRDPFEKPTEPVDCGACDGVGRVANEDAESPWTPMWVDCRACDGTGSTVEPNVLDSVTPAWGLGSAHRDYPPRVEARRHRAAAVGTRGDAA